MKRILTLVMILAVAMICFCAVAEEVATEVEAVEEVIEEVVEEVEEEPVIMYVSGCGTLKVFAEPSYAAAEIGAISANMPVAVGEKSKSGRYTFVEVTYTQLGNELTGYVNAAFLTEEEPVRADYPAITAVNMSLREDPYTAGAAIVKIPAGTKVNVWYESGHWCYVNVQIGSKVYFGYCYNEFVTKEAEKAEEAEEDMDIGGLYE